MGSTTPSRAQQQPKEIEHTWTRVFYGELDGKERLLFGGGFERAKPALADLDGDGDKDLVVGNAAGTLLYFENQGSAAQPRWRLVNEALSAEYPEGEREGEIRRRAVDVGENSAPAFADIDGDGDSDLFVASAAGKLHFFRNIGNRYLPVFRLESSDFLGADFGRNLVAAFADANGDGLPDLALGNGEGFFFVVINQGSRLTPHFCTEEKVVPPACMTPARRLGRLDPEDNAVPAWVDWDGDGDLDLMIGKSDGRVAFFRNIGDARRASWELAVARFMILDIGGYASPAFGDFTGDGRPDLLLAGDGDLFSYYTNRQSANGSELWLESKNVLRTARLGRFQSRLHATSGDLDGDGRPDLLIGTRGGQVLIYDNVGANGKVALRSHPEPLLPTPKRAYSAPALGDLDGDGDLDLVVGDRNGRLELIENVGTPENARWRLLELFFGRIDVGSMSTPVFQDTDGDGDLDLLVGNSLGNLVYYQNRGGAGRPDFLLQNIRFGGMKMGSHASPAVFSFDPKGPVEIVLGGRRGELLSAVRNPNVRAGTPRAYQRQAVPWESIRTKGYSAPHFMDLTGDGRPDLLLGGENGTLALWRYEGARPRTKGAPARLADLRRNIVPGVERQSGGGASRAPVAAQRAELLRGSNELAALDPIFVAAEDPVSELAVGKQAKPVFFDADGDGRLDLLVGTRGGQLLLFRNLTSQAGTAWGKAVPGFAGYRHGRNAAPAVADLDGDGDLDLVVGTEEGRVYYWENTGGAGKPKLRFLPEALTNIRAGKNAVPAFADLNGDGKIDLLVGNLRGQLHFYRREPGKEVGFKLVERRFLGIDVGINASPSFAFLVGGQTPVLLVGSDRGRFTVMLPPQPGEDGGWTRNKSFLEGLRMPLGSHGALADLDQDGDLDLYVGGETGRIEFFRNNALVPAGAR